MSVATGPQARRAGAGPTREDELRQLASVRAELLREFGDRLSTEQVEQRFAETVSRFDGAPIRSFVPVLAQRSVRLELRRSLSQGAPAA